MYIISNTYPATDYTNPISLYNSLGSFWTQLFNEKATLRGYTIGLAEELAQSYYILADTINSYSVNDIPVLNKEKWYPIIIRQSEYNKSKLIFNQNDAYFGAQPAADVYYEKRIFQFGYPKVPTENVYAVQVPASFGNFYTIANRVVAPSVLFVKNVDVVLNNSVLYFNTNLFDNALVTQFPIIDDTGEPSTFVDDSGNTVSDTYIVLWVYHCEVDNNDLTNNFGFIYDLNLPSTEDSKKILQGIVKLATTGPTIQAVKMMLAAAAGIPAIVETTETIEYIGVDKFSSLVVTNANVYRYNSTLQLLPTVQVGAMFNAGDILVDAIEYFDSSVLPNWWETAFAQYQTLPVSSDVFMGNYNYQLIFKNTLDLITLSTDGTINFPVEGQPADVATFNSYLNLPANQSTVTNALGLSLNPSTYKTVLPIVPVQFIFNNFFKDNMALFKISLPDPDTTASFLSFFESIRKMLPPHVYVMFNINLNVPVDEYENLNGEYTIDALTGQTFNADGSNAAGTLVYQSPYYYKDLATQLFALGYSPIKSSKVLTDASNLDKVYANSLTGQAHIISAKVFTVIPDGATTSTIRTLNILDYTSPYQ